MKKKNKQKTDSKLNEHDKRYAEVALAIAHLSKIEYEERKRKEAKAKAQRLFLRLSFFGCIIFMSLSLVTNHSFNFEWLADFGEWYSEIYIYLMIYVFTTGLVLLFERKLGLDKKAWFEYVWPFIGFFISMFLGKTMVATIKPASINTLIGIFMIGGLLSFFLIKTSADLGKEIANQEADATLKAIKTLEENPSVADQVLNDFDNYMKQESKDSDGE